MSRGSVRIGTSGWHYRHWKGPFYPADLASEKMLPSYCERFDTVEVNSSFYRLPRLEAFLGSLSSDHRHAFELRDPSWLTDDTFALLKEHRVAHCIYQYAGRESPRRVTSELVYVRLHGPGDAYQGSYEEPALRGWADALGRWAGQGRQVFCYFDNDEAGHAPNDALRLRAMLG